MKKATFLFVFILIISNDLQCKPNLQSTMNWIIGKLEGYYKVPNSDFRYQSLKYDPKKKILYIRKDGENDPVYKILLKDINPYNIETQAFESTSRGGLCGNIIISTVEGKYTITACFSDSTLNYEMRGLPIVIPDNNIRSEPDLPERLKTAFKSAIESLTGKKEVF